MIGMGGRAPSRRDFVLGGLAVAGAGAMLPRFATAQDRVKRIDTHSHYFCPEWKEADAAFAQKIGAPAPFTNSWTVEKSLDDMAKGGVTTAVLSLPSIPGNWFGGDPATATRLARASNDYAAKLAQDHPGRFGVWAALPMLDVDASLKEIEHAIDTLKADGIGLATVYGNKWPGDPMYMPIWEEINRRKLTVYFHPSTPACCTNLIPGVQPAILEVPEDTTRAATSLLINGVFAKMKNTKWLFSHSGGTLPSLAGRINSFFAGDHPDKNLHEFAPDGIMAEFAKLNFDTANGAWPSAMAGLRKIVPVSHITYGSDYPYFRTAMNTEQLAKLGFTKAELKGIDSENAMRLLPKLRAM